MNKEEAKEFAKTMTYRDAIYNLKQARRIPYKKATFEVINKLLNELDKIESCSDCVSRQEIMELPRYSTVIGEIVYLDGIKALPSVQPKPKMGHWIDCGDRELWYECSECRERVWGSHYKYCPSCGAKMEQEE